MEMHLYIPYNAFNKDFFFFLAKRKKMPAQCGTFIVTTWLVPFVTFDIPKTKKSLWMISFGISLSNYEQFYDSIGKWFPVVFPGIAETVRRQGYWGDIHFKLASKTFLLSLYSSMNLVICHDLILSGL